jgi:hypothetical protein
MKNHFGIYLTIILAIFVTACGSVQVVKVDPVLSPTDKTGTGYIAGSVSKLLSGDEKSPFGHNWIIIRKTGTENLIRLGFSHNGIMDTVPDFENNELLGAVFRTPVQPGTYEISGLRFYYNNGVMEKTFYLKEPLSIPINIEENKTTYIGAFTARGIWGNNFLGIGIPIGGYYLLNDESHRDLKIISEKTPGFDAMKTIIKIPDVPSEANVYFRRNN